MKPKIREGKIISHIQVSPESKLMKINGEIVILDKCHPPRTIHSTESGEIIAIKWACSSTVLKKILRGKHLSK